MKKTKKILASIMGISLSMSIFATNLHAENSSIHKYMRTYIDCKNYLCNYMTYRDIGSLNFFTLVYNLNLLPRADRQLITSISQNIYRSLIKIRDEFYRSNRENQAKIIKSILEEYCNYKRYDYNQILNIINSNQITDCDFFPFQNASIEPGIHQQHGMELSVTFNKDLTSIEKGILYICRITCDDNSIHFGM